MSNRIKTDNATTDPRIIQILQNRQLMVDALISGKHKQKRHGLGEWWNDTGPVCIYGLAYRLFQKDEDKSDPQYHTTTIVYVNVGKLLGIEASRVNYLIQANDAGMTFRQLATKIKDTPITIYT